MTARNLLLSHDNKFILTWIKEHRGFVNFGLDAPVFCNSDPQIMKKKFGYVFIHPTGRFASIYVRDDYRLLILVVPLTFWKSELDLYILDLRTDALLVSMNTIR